jgi:predicted pyridoxine 5'-phosphate oxidase superfamily flavin-nucleotide-binding protein
MAAPITPENWHTIRQNFRSGFATNLHVAIATVGASGQPNVTPIGSFFLNRDDFTGFYFEIFTRNIPQNAKSNPAVCIMAVNGGRWFWLKSLLFGKFRTPPMTKLCSTKTRHLP